MDQITKIVELTLAGEYSRREIANKVGKSKFTVWKYQKLFLGENI